MLILKSLSVQAAPVHAKGCGIYKYAHCSGKQQNMILGEFSSWLPFSNLRQQCRQREERREVERKEEEKERGREGAEEEEIRVLFSLL